MRNIVERDAVLFEGETIDAFGVDQLLGRTAPLLSVALRALPRPDAIPTKHSMSDTPIDLKAQIEGIELERIQASLDRADGVIYEARC